MEPWLPFAVGALIVWSIQRVVTKVALVRRSTPRQLIAIGLGIVAAVALATG